MRNDRTTKKTITLYGKHPCIAALRNMKRVCLEILITNNTYEQSRDLIESLAAQKCTKITKTDINKLSSLLPQDAVHQGIALRVYPLEHNLEYILNSADENSTIVMLDQVIDPHNVGAVLRSATAFGADAVIATRHNSPSESAVISKTSSGTIEITPLIYVANLVQTMKMLKKHNYWCYGLDCHQDKSVPPDSLQLEKRTVIVLGSEDRGLRHLTKDNCDFLVKIPIASTVDSLNVSSAAAVMLYVASTHKKNTTQ